MKKVFLIGYSGHAYVIIDILQCMGYEVIGYAEEQKKENNPYGLIYLGNEDVLIKRKDLLTTPFIVGIGNNIIRRGITKKMVDNGFEMINAIHPSAVIARKVSMAKGIVVMAKAVINPMADIGEGVIVNTGAIIEHDCNISDYVHIAPGAVLAGNVTVGVNSFVGANSVVRQGISIGSNVLVGAGAVIVNNISDGITVAGNPARKDFKS